jgi:hypothetical protein
MRKALTIWAGLLLAGALAIPAIAQITPKESASFNQFLSKHPNMAQKLEENPGLARNPQFIASHPEFQQFLSNHPGVAGQLNKSPGRFMSREGGGYEWGPGEGEPWHGGYGNQYGAGHPPYGNPGYGNPGYGNPGYGNPYGNPSGYNGYGHPMRNTDNYLDDHHEVAEQLQKNPGLVDDPNYMKNHPGLQEFMQNHPTARQEWKSHPGQFMYHEDQYQQKHPNH